jgi:serine/threonine protein kinase
VVKVLDFGLAKLIEEPAASADSAQLHTQAGVFMGTPAFMSPEQAEGKPVDPRSDIFSFGTVLYQMTTGKSASSGDSLDAAGNALCQWGSHMVDARRPGRRGETAHGEQEHPLARLIFARRPAPGVRPAHPRDKL